MKKTVFKEGQIKTKGVKCAFCHGTGRDPFDQLYPGSTCQVCNGRKALRVAIPCKACHYCHGCGVEFGTQNTCTACSGRGVISINKSEMGAVCKRCMGTGMNLETDLPCALCHGLGEV